jgi:transcriptional regulator of heat shock response
MRLKIKQEELDKSEQCQRELDSINRIHKMENETMREKLDAMREELNRAHYQRDRSNDLEHKENIELRQRLLEYEKVAADIDKAFEDLSRQDQEWQGVYLKNVMVVQEGPKKLHATIQLLKRLEQKVREVNILRKEMKEIQKDRDEAWKDKEVAIQTMAGGPNPSKHLMDMIYEREDQLKEARRVRERMEQDYHILFQEIRDVKGVRC